MNGYSSMNGYESDSPTATAGADENGNGNCTCSCSSKQPKEDWIQKILPKSLASMVVQPVHLIGGGGGTSFWHHKVDSGAVVKEITVWKDSGALRAVKIVFTDSTMKIAGKTTGDSKTLRFAPGEKCTDLSLWGNGIGTRCGRIRIYTSEGQSFDWGMHGGKDEYPIDVGSGILVGFCGGEGNDIDRLGALFIKPIRRIVSSVDYGPLPPGREGIQSIELDSYQHVNESSSDLNWSWRKSVSKTSSQTWSQSASFTFGMSISVQAGIPKVVDVGAETHWELSIEASHEISESQTKELGWDVSGTLEPGKSVRLTAVTEEGKSNLPYTSTVTIYLQDGYTHTYTEHGVYKGVSYSQVDVRSSDKKRISS